MTPNPLMPTTLPGATSATARSGLSMTLSMVPPFDYLPLPKKRSITARPGGAFVTHAPGS
jgi:hypothetical protein